MNRRRKILLLSSLFFLFVAAACGCHIWRELHTRAAEQEVFEKLEDGICLPEDPSPSPEAGLETERLAGMVSHDIERLQTINQDCIGWLTIPDTIITYPVAHSPADPERYLHRDIYGASSYSGTPFLDARCNPLEGNLIIYGHNMINGTMFGSLKKYQSSGYMEKHSKAYLELSDGLHVFEVVSAIRVEKDDPWYCFLSASSEKEAAAWITELREARGVHFGDNPSGDERFLTLSTCTGNRQNERLIVVFREIVTAQTERET